MARQPEHIIPFRPFASGMKPSKPAFTVTDDRRAWFASVPGEVYSNEVLIPGTGAWDDMDLAPPAELTEVIRLRLPRPEPVSVTVGTFYNSNFRFRRSLHLYSHVNGTGSLSLASQGRLIMEWGTGKATYWCYCDLAHSGIQLPAVSEIRIWGWSYQFPCLVNASIQVGYAHSQLDMTWTQMLDPNPPIVETVTRRMPNFTKTLTGYYYSDDVNDYGRIFIRDRVGINMHEFRMFGAIPPNTQALPYGPNDVPLSGAADHLFLRVDPVGVPTANSLAAIVKIRI